MLLFACLLSVRKATCMNRFSPTEDYLMLYLPVTSAKLQKKREFRLALCPRNGAFTRLPRSCLVLSNGKHQSLLFLVIFQCCVTLTISDDFCTWCYNAPFLVIRMPTCETKTCECELIDSRIAFFIFVACTFLFYM